MSPGTVNVQWLKDNKAIAGSNCKTYKKDDIYYLEVTNLSTDDNGLYTVVASNLKKSISSSSTLNVLSGINTELYRQFESCHRLILFTVLGDSRPTSPGGSFLPHPPKFKVKLKDTELLEGSAAVRFEVIVRGLPVPTISL